MTFQQKNAERIAFKRSHSSSHNTLSRGPGRPPHTDIPMDELFPLEDEVIYKLLKISFPNDQTLTVLMFSEL